MSEVYLNGEFLPAEQACVPVLDRGFLLGDGVYEVIPAYGGNLFRLDEHLDRLDNSLAAIRLANPLDREQWATILQRLVDASGATEQSVYLQVTRGVAARDHAFPDPARPTVFAMSNPIAAPNPRVADEGVAAITLEDTRWRYCNIKAITLLPNVLLRQQAIDQGAQEAILVRDGEVTEGAASNVFVVVDGVILTPPKSPHLLPGITRDLVLELAADAGLPAEQRLLSEATLNRAEEIWLTSSTKEILPVTSLNGQTVGEGRPGPLWRRLSELYRAYKDRLAAAPAP